MSLLTNFQDFASAVKSALDRKADKSEIPTVPVTDVEDSNGNSLVSNGVATIPAATIPAQGQSDWSKNDSDDPSYIKNRTHYESLRTELVDPTWDGDFEADNAPELLVETEADGETIKVYKLTDTINAMPSGSAYPFDFELDKLKSAITLNMGGGWIVSHTGTITEFFTEFFAEAVSMGVITQEAADESLPAVLASLALGDVTEFSELNDSDKKIYVQPYGFFDGEPNVFLMVIYVPHGSDGDYELFVPGETVSFTEGIYAVAEDTDITTMDGFTVTPIILGTVVKLPYKYLPDELAVELNSIRTSMPESSFFDLYIVGEGSTTDSVYHSRVNKSPSELAGAMDAGKIVRLIDNRENPVIPYKINLMSLGVQNNIAKFYGEMARGVNSGLLANDLPFALGMDIEVSQTTDNGVTTYPIEITTGIICGLDSARASKLNDLPTAAQITTLLNGKADLVNGKVPISQIPITGSEVKNGTDLVIAESTANTVGNKTVGSIIKIPETNNGVISNFDYIVVSQRNGVTVALRDKTFGRTWNNTTGSSLYYGAWNINTWLNEDFLTRFSSTLQDCFVADTTKMQVNSASLQEVSVKAFVPSHYELGLTNELNTGENWIDALKVAKDTIDGDTARIAQNESGTTISYGVRDGDWWGFMPITTSGTKGTVARPYDSTQTRVAVYIKNTSNLDENDVLINSGGVTYTDTVDKIQDGNNYYKIKDQDARTALENKEAKGKATISNTEYNLERHTLSVTDNGTTTTYNFLTAEVQT